MADEQKVAIVTGASSGIGRATAVGLARRAYAVTLAARREDRLRDIARLCDPAEALVVPTDVSDPSQVQAMVEKTLSRFGRLDVLVANAGYGLFARVDETPPDEMRRIMDVNFMGVFFACQAALPAMKKQGGGHIFVVSSVIGKRGTPFHGAYCASKFAICGLAESMRVEMAPFGIRVTTVCPALTDTEFFDKSVRGQAAKTSFSKFKSLTPPQVVAEKIVHTIGKNRPELVFTLGGKFLVLVSELFPRLADLMMKVYFKDLAARVD